MPTTKSTTKTAKTAEATKLSLNEKIAKLDRAVEWFSSDDFKLEDAMDNYKSAAALAQEIEQDLLALKNTITVLTEDFSKDQ